MKYMDMLDIRKILEEEDVIEAMENKGFVLINSSDGDFDNPMFFVNEDNDFIIMYDENRNEFWCFSRGNHGVLSKFKSAVLECDK